MLANDGIRVLNLKWPLAKSFSRDLATIGDLALSLASLGNVAAGELNFRPIGFFNRANLFHQAPRKRPLGGAIKVTA
jgi:hypothetical protein